MYSSWRERLITVHKQVYIYFRDGRFSNLCSDETHIIGLCSVLPSSIQSVQGDSLVRCSGLWGQQRMGFLVVTHRQGLHPILDSIQGATSATVLLLKWPKLSPCASQACPPGWMDSRMTRKECRSLCRLLHNSQRRIAGLEGEKGFQCTAFASPTAE